MKKIAQVGHRQVQNVIFSPTENLFATSGYSDIVRIWSLSKREIFQLPHESILEGCVFSRDGRWLVTACFDRTGRVWNLSTGEELLRMTHDGSPITASIISPDCKFFASSGKDGFVKIWKTPKVWVGLVLKGLNYYTKVAFSADGKNLVFNSDQGVLKIFETTNWRPFLNFTEQHAYRWDFNHDGKLLAFANKEVIKVIEISTGNLVSLIKPKDQVLSLSFGSRANLLAIGYKNGTVQILDVITSLPIATVAHIGDPRYSFLDIVSLAFSPDGKFLATASHDHTLRLWETTNWKEIQRLVFDDRVEAVSFAPNGTWAAALIITGVVSIFDPGTGKILANIKHQEGGVRPLAGKFIEAYAISPDSRLLGTVSNDHTARIWDPINGRELHQFLHEGYVKCLTFSPDGKWLATGSDDKTCRIWNIDTGQEFLRFDTEVLSLAFSPDGAFLVIASRNKTIRVWLWRPEDLIKEACTRLTRNLTLDEWRQYLPDETYRATCPNLPIPEN